MHSPARLAIALIFAVAAASCGSSSSPSSPSSPAPTPTPAPATPGAVSIVSGATSLTTTAYNPNPITVSVGGTVTWVNHDSITHTSTANDGSWNSGSMAPGASFSKTFQSAGTFQYHCAIHPNMIGTVTVQ